MRNEMMTRHLFNVCVLVFITVLDTGHALSSPSYSSASPQRPRGCAATPLDKKAIAVFGGGGYLGSYIFGFLQRAASLYGTGMGGSSSSPRMLCATSPSSQSMNRVLGKHFALAYAGEQHVRLTNMASVDAIAKRLEGYDAVVLGTMYGLEQRPVSGGTYETSPNSKTLEFYLDCPPATTTKDDEDYDLEVHLALFDNTLQACQESNVQHVVVLETPQTMSSEDFLSRLQTSKLPYTYIRLNGELINCADHVHYKGIQGDLVIEQSLMSSSSSSTTGKSPIYREDVAAIVCQSLQSLPWTESRCLSISSKGDWTGAIQTVKGRQDREWCGNSQTLATKFISL